MSVARWNVPRPGRDGKPLGALVVEVVPAEAYDRCLATLVWVARRYAETLDDKPVRDADECLEAAAILTGEAS